MRKHLWVVALVVTAAVIAVLAGCGRGSVAEINGKKISRDEFNNYMQLRAGTQMLQQMLDDRLTLAMAEKRKVSPTDEQVTKQFDALNKIADLEAMMKERGLTKDQIKDELKVMVARQNLALKEMDDRITDEQVKQAYESQKAQRYDIPERVRVEIVSFKTKDTADEAAKAIAGGASLEQASADSEGSPVMKQVVPKSGPGMPPEIVKAAFNTPKGKTSKPVKLSFAPGQEQWLIIKATDRIPAAKISFEEAEPMIRGDIATAMAQQDPDYQKEMKEARKSAKVKVLDPALKQAEKNFKQQ